MKEKEKDELAIPIEFKDVMLEYEYIDTQNFGKEYNKIKFKAYSDAVYTSYE
jgi:hypothetical protein